MNKHLDKYLCEKYPKIFADRNKSMQESCMHWGFEHNEGWFHIIDVGCSQIQHHIDNPRWVPKTDLLSRLKTLWNMTMWNGVICHVAKLSLIEPPIKLQQLRCLSGKYPKKWQWKIHGWLFKWFSFDIKYEPSKIPMSQLVADQVKEKFGGLRFYHHGGTEYTEAIVNMMEALSYRVCELCGTMDETVTRNSGGWIVTTCEKCTPKHSQAEHKKNRNKNLVKAWEKSRNENKRKTTSNAS